jgi:hypothetical protein
MSTGTTLYHTFKIQQLENVVNLFVKLVTMFQADILLTFISKYVIMNVTAISKKSRFLKIYF